MATILKCNKTLIHGDGSESFTKGHKYVMMEHSTLSNPRVVNNQGEYHSLGGWSKHFKQVNK
jgi:hypothetical protein